MARLTADQKAFHVKLAYSHADTARRMRASYEHQVTMALAAHGNGDGVMISGVYRSHFPDSIKTELRDTLDLVYSSWDHSQNHWRKAGRLYRTWIRDVRVVR